MKATIFIAIPGYGYHLLREAAEKKKDFSALKIFVGGGERLSRVCAPSSKNCSALWAPKTRAFWPLTPLPRLRRLGRSAMKIPAITFIRIWNLLNW